jgi:FKBP-type peptidyl-prolyl cis-trans isomerase SlyD
MIRDGQVVSLNFTLKDDAGRELDASGHEPLVYLHGAEQIPEGLERALTGKSVGDRFVAVVSPSEGYGEKEADSRASVPRSEFPEEIELEVGLPVVLEDENGEPDPVWIAEVSEDEVVLDRNHPLAGVTLHFEVEVVAVREATQEERAHGHAHGGDGHEH